MRVWPTALLGFLATAALTVAGGLRGGLFHNSSAAPWLFQFNTDNSALRTLLSISYLLGIVGLCVAWWRTVQLAKAGAIGGRHIAGLFGLWSLPLFFAAPLFSGDVYVYYVDGEAAARGFNPYDSGVSALGSSPLLHMIFPLWRDTPTMYGPVFIRLAELVAYVASSHLVVGVMILRAISLVSLAVAGIAMAAICRRTGRSVGEALSFALLNPLVMLHLVGGVHNDGIMLGFLFAGLAVGVCSKNWSLRGLALLLCALAGAVKFPGFAGVLLLGWIWAGGRGRPVVHRAAGAVLGGLAGAAMFVGITALCGLGWGWIEATDVPGLAHPLLSPPNALAMSFGGLFDVGFGMNQVTRPIATVLSLVLGVWLVARSGRRASADVVLRAGGWGLLAVAWLGPSVYPWYLTWGVMLAGLFVVGPMRNMLMGAVISVSFLIAPGSTGWLDRNDDWRRTVTAFVMVAIFTWAIRRILRINHIDRRDISAGLKTLVSRPQRPAARRLSNAGAGTQAERAV